MINKIVILFSLLLLLGNPVQAAPQYSPKGVTHYEKGKSHDGFTLFAPMGGVIPAQRSRFYLIDLRGNIVHEWNVKYGPLNYGYLLKNGNLLYEGIIPKEPLNPRSHGSSVIQEVDWNSNVVWEYENNYLNHDFELLPNGDLLFIVWEKMTPENQERLYKTMPIRDENITVWSNAILQINRKTKKIVWEWHAQQGLDIEKYSVKSLVKNGVQGVGIIPEWTHLNSVKFLPEGNPFNKKKSLLISLSNIDSVMILDYDTKKIIWEWGPGEISKQHDATMLSSGNILLYDNGVYRRDEVPYSRIIELDPKTKKIVWEYTGKGFYGSEFYSSLLGGTQALKNGNVLVSEGLTGRIFEIKRGQKSNNTHPWARTESKYENRIVWEYVNPYIGPTSMMENAVYRAYRYGPDDVDWPVRMPNPDPGLAENFFYAVRNFMQKGTRSSD